MEVEVDRETRKGRFRVTVRRVPFATAVTAPPVSTDNKHRKSDNYFRCQTKSVISSMASV